MAREIVNSPNEVVLVLNRQEAVNIIGLLGAQLADRPLVGNLAGACPEVRLTGADGLVRRTSFLVESTAVPTG